MTAILKVDTIQDTAGNNIINESSDTITIGASGDTIALAGTTVTGITQGITMADSWRITANFNTSGADITANWERDDTFSPGQIGSAMTESSGVFTFPSTGVYLITAQSFISASSGNPNYIGLKIAVTEDNSAYQNGSLTYTSTDGTAQHESLYCTYLFDVTNTSTHKVKMTAEVEGSDTATYDGNSVNKHTGFDFIRLGDST